jgi:hypothetical protein
LEGQFSAALLVPWQGAAAVCDARQNVDEKRLARLCLAVARSNALLTAWQALALALVEPELRETLATTEETAKLDVVLSDTPALATWFEPSVRSSAATELRAMLDNAVVLPAVQPASLSQWFDKPVARLASLAAEHLALQLESHGMRALPFVLGVPSSPAFRELAVQSSVQLRRLWESLAEFPMRQVPPSLVDQWIADLYMEGRYVGRTRSDVVARGDAAESQVGSAESARGALDSDMPPTIPRAVIASPAVTDAASREAASLRDTVRPGRPNPTAPPRAQAIVAPAPRADEVAFGDEALEPNVERAIDEEWITLAGRHASPHDPPGVESPRPEPAIVLILRRLAHAGLSVFAGALAGFAAIAVFTTFAGRGDRHPELEGDLEVERSAPVAVPIMPSTAAEPVAVVPLVAMVPEPPPGPAGFGLAEPPLGSATAAQIASPAVTPKTLNSKTCDVALVYAVRGEIAQAITRFESCPSPERELVRYRIGERGAAEVRAKAEKGQCDEAAAIVAQVESIEAARPAKAAFASLCDTRVREVEEENETPLP